ncbi:unnamed protein product [Amoebophrya sp. A120]|nr:unnamed protein product [Amoebophrya sp. A120]|eukprot:GSA120T00010678001.1
MFKAFQPSDALLDQLSKRLEKDHASVPTAMQSKPLLGVPYNNPQRSPGKGASTSEADEESRKHMHRLAGANLISQSNKFRVKSSSEVEKNAQMFATTQNIITQSNATEIAQNTSNVFAQAEFSVETFLKEQEEKRKLNYQLSSMAAGNIHGSAGAPTGSSSSSQGNFSMSPTRPGRGGAGATAGGAAGATTGSNYTSTRRGGNASHNASVTSDSSITLERRTDRKWEEEARRREEQLRAKSLYNMSAMAGSNCSTAANISSIVREHKKRLQDQSNTVSTMASTAATNSSFSQTYDGATTTTGRQDVGGSSTAAGNGKIPDVFARLSANPLLTPATDRFSGSASSSKRSLYRTYSNPQPATKSLNSSMTLEHLMSQTAATSSAAIPANTKIVVTENGFEYVPKGTATGGSSGAGAAGGAEMDTTSSAAVNQDIATSALQQGGSSAQNGAASSTTRAAGSKTSTKSKRAASVPPLPLIPKYVANAEQTPKKSFWEDDGPKEEWAVANAKDFHATRRDPTPPPPPAPKDQSVQESVAVKESAFFNNARAAPAGAASHLNSKNYTMTPDDFELFAATPKSSSGARVATEEGSEDYGGGWVAKREKASAESKKMSGFLSNFTDIEPQADESDRNGISESQHAKMLSTMENIRRSASSTVRGSPGAAVSDRTMSSLTPKIEQEAATPKASSDVLAGTSFSLAATVSHASPQKSTSSTANNVHANNQSASMTPTSGSAAKDGAGAAAPGISGSVSSPSAATRREPEATMQPPPPPPQLPVIASRKTGVAALSQTIDLSGALSGSSAHSKSRTATGAPATKASGSTPNSRRSSLAATWQALPSVPEENLKEVGASPVSQKVVAAKHAGAMTVSSSNKTGAGPPHNQMLNQNYNNLGQTQPLQQTHNSIIASSSSSQQLQRQTIASAMAASTNATTGQHNVSSTSGSAPQSQLHHGPATTMTSSLQQGTSVQPGGGGGARSLSPDERERALFLREPVPPFRANAVPAYIARRKNAATRRPRLKESVPLSGLYSCAGGGAGGGVTSSTTSTAGAMMNNNAGSSDQRVGPRGTAGNMMGGDAQAQLLGRSRPRSYSTSSAEQGDVEEQRVRLAMKMEMVGFYQGCQDNFASMTAKQNLILRKKMAGGGDKLQTQMRLFGTERDQQMEKWASRASDPAVVQKRLKQVHQHFHHVPAGDSGLAPGGTAGGDNAVGGPPAVNAESVEL